MVIKSNIKTGLFRLLFCLCSLLPVLASPTALAESSLGRSLFTQSSNDNDEILSPDQAFKLAVEAVDSNTLRAVFQIAPGHYLYRERIKFDIASSPNNAKTISIASIDLPPGDIKQDPTFGETHVFHKNFEALIHLNTSGSSTENSSPITLGLLASYQGCSEKGLCYAPIHKTLEVPLLSDISGNSSANTSKPAATQSNSDDDATGLLKSGKLWLIAIGFFGFGLLLSFTPCMLPMIPILSGMIVRDAQSQDATSKPDRLRVFNLSLAYTLGMALTYTVAGIGAGLSGHLLSNALQNAWVLGFFALVFILLALSMFGFYELRLPSKFENAIVDTSNRFNGGRLIGLFIMGAFSALIVSPCVAAPLAGALIYISQTHDVLLGGVALFSMAIGMGIPLLLIGLSAGFIPKTGAWMVTVRQFFGVIMLAVAVWLISPVIPVSLQLLLWAALFIVPATYIGAFDRLDASTGGWARLCKSLGIIMLLLGAMLIIGAASGAKSALQPLSGLKSGLNVEQNKNLPFQRVHSVTELDNAIKNAAGKTVMLDFYADWCVACKELEQFTFRDPGVANALQNVVLLQADVTQNSAEDTALLKRFNLFGPPGIIFFDAAGQEISHAKTIGYKDADALLATLNKLH
ncbi:MAG TPA: protein-disulfide reductase DsbD [Methyloradius sp.]